MPRIIQIFISTNLTRFIILYLAGSWGLIDASNFFVERFKLPDPTLDAIIILLSIGFPLMIVLIFYLNKKNDPLKTKLPEKSPKIRCRDISFSHILLICSFLNN